jgi:hypothetical protein
MGHILEAFSGLIPLFLISQNHSNNPPKSFHILRTIRKDFFRITFFAQLIFFPPKFFCSERFTFFKIPEKVFTGKKLTEQKSFLIEQKRLVRFF